MLMSKLRPRRFTSKKIFRVNKTLSSRNKMRRNAAKLIYSYIYRDTSSSMFSEKISILTEKAKEIAELKALIQEKLREQMDEVEDALLNAFLKELEVDIEPFLKESSKERAARRKRIWRSIVSIAQKKIVERIFGNELGVKQGMRDQIPILLFGERYAPWRRISPPNRSKICWRSAAVVG